MKDKNREICKKIREIRKSMKLTQSQFAELCDLSEDSIGKIEREVTIPTIETLQKIASSLNRPVEVFLKTTLKDKSCSGLSAEISALVAYLRTRSPGDTKFIHELAVKILERQK